MSKFQSFDELIDSLQGAVIRSYTLTRNQHILAMNDYFDKDGNPHMIKIKLPYEAEGGEKEHEVKTRVVEVPAFSLIPQVSLKMNKINMNFDVKLVDSREEEGQRKNAFDEQISDSDSGRSLKSQKKSLQKLLTNVFAGTDDSNTVHVELEFTSGEPPEGIMRINDMLIRLMP